MTLLYSRPLSSEAEFPLSSPTKCRSQTRPLLPSWERCMGNSCKAAILIWPLPTAESPCMWISEKEEPRDWSGAFPPCTGITPGHNCTHHEAATLYLGTASSLAQRQIYAVGRFPIAP